MHVFKSAAGQAAVVPADALHGDSKVVLEVQGSEEGSSPSCRDSAASEAEPELSIPDDIEELAGSLDPACVVLLRFECLSGRELKVMPTCMHAACMHGRHLSCACPSPPCLAMHRPSSPS